jgi:hypothetical protein
MREQYRDVITAMALVAAMMGFVVGPLFFLLQSH